MSADASIRYSSSDSNSNALLRSGLAQVAGLRCYACSEPKSITDLQIDHLVPRSASSTTGTVRGRALQLPAGIHVDDPENLAVICGHCNRLKSDGDYRNQLVFEMHRRRAIQRADEVRKFVRAVRSGHKLAISLLSAAEADLADDEARGLFLNLAPAVVQQLAGIGENHVDFTTVETALGEDCDLRYDVRLMLRNQLRLVRDLTSTIWSVDLLAIAREAAAQVASDLEDRAGSAIADSDEPPASSQLHVGSPDLLHLELTFDQAEVQRDGGTMKYRLRGAADGW